MVKKAGITVIGYPKILSSSQKVAEEYANSANFLYYQYNPETRGVTYISSSPDHPLSEAAKNFESVNHDIIVVGIVTAKEMKGLDQNKVIPFRAGSMSIVKAFLKAKKIANRAAFISPVEEKHNVDFFQKLTNLSIDIYYASNLSEYRGICLKAKKAGHTVVVSGSYTFQIAREYDLKPVFIFSDHEIFHDAYTRALETCRYNQSLGEKVSQLEIITRESRELIIYIDKKQHVTFTNKAAEKKLKFPPEKIKGRHITELFDFIKSNVLTESRGSQKNRREIIGNLNGEEILVQFHPVYVGSETAGTILMAKTAKDISAMDTRIRQKMRFKGFRAKYTFHDILGESPAVEQCKKYAGLYALSDSPVLIYGATGTGKELFAQAMHNAGRRKRFPFVAINCATLPSELMESELFGYVGGAFTGAGSQGKQGLVDQAHLGTLFLDEVDSLSTTLQAKLLRLLQEKEFIRIGGNEIIPVDIRIIAACNRNPNLDEGNNLLRQDLFYRLSILYLNLPTLAERKEDIMMLFYHFLKSQDSIPEDMVYPLDDECEKLLTSLPFHGNLRELQGIAARFACLCEEDGLKKKGYIKEVLLSCLHPEQRKTAVNNFENRMLTYDDASLSQVMKRAEKAVLEEAKQKCDGSVRLMSQKLKIGRTTLWRKMKEHGLA